MKPDKLDIKIQQAAAQSEPVYDEQAWSAMEKLLDEKMPQKKNNKRKILWLFLLLFLGTGALLATYPWGNTEDVVVSAKRNTGDASAARSSASSQPINTMVEGSDKDVIAQQSAIQRYMSKKAFRSQEPQKVQKIIKNKITQDKARESKNNIDQPITSLGKNIEENESGNSHPTTKRDAAMADINNTEENNTDNLLVKEKNKDTLTKKIIAPKDRNKFINSFALSFSLGPDVSGVSINNTGKINLAYGVGISYQLSKRLTLRTGFYVEKKVYDANAPDYHLPARFWNYYPYLKYIDADCKVYEVPLIVNYNFSQTPKYHWFGSAGISSYFMKKEDYNFFSKNPWDKPHITVIPSTIKTGIIFLL